MVVVMAKRPAPGSDDKERQVAPDEGELSPAMRELILRSKVEERRTRPDSEVDVAERRRRGDSAADAPSHES
jgi:hypothetical protein